MGVGHPLDPLTPEEIKAAAAAIKATAAQKDLSPLRFNVITLAEPTKAELIAYEANPDNVPARAADVILQAYPKAPLIEATVLLSGAKPTVTAWEEVQDREPLLTPEDCILAEDIAKADPEVVALLKEKYGLTDLALVACDPWSVHMPPIEGRLIQLWMYERTHLDDNHYSHPIDFVPLVDLNLNKVVHIDFPWKDAAEPWKVPKANSNYHRNLMDKGWRTSLKPLNIDQPEGPSFTVEGNLIKWEKWHIRTSFNYREGLVLHNVGYEDGGKVRPILHRGSLVEMAVPYGDPHAPFQRKCAFDVGDYGLGFCANSLALGCDCLGHIKYFDAVLNDSKGEPWEIKKAVCLHEEDAGILWKHMEYRNSHAEVRRSRRLVLSFVATVVNYEYCFYWHFYQDGTIEYQIKLTGELSTNPLSPDEDPANPKYGTLVAEGVNAQAHQHLFCARLDFSVDDPAGGKGLTVSEVNVEALPDGPENPYGNGFVAVETDLTSEAKAQRVCDPFKARLWKVKNPNSLNPITGKPVAYKIMTNAAPVMLATPSSLLQKRGGFALKNIWVTPHSEQERWPAGDYTIQSKGGEGLPLWTKQNRRVDSGNDPVVWHSFGVTHIVRTEDFPVMPVEHVGFTLKPFGFFDSNPGVDIPYAPNAASKLVNGCCNGNGVANGHANGNGVANGHANGNGTTNGYH
ncbi:Primary amine oxidase [Coccomyxa sp. Obi]|nr:Primary amine oxidase [Coccomyxa sp. Obi]